MKLVYIITRADAVGGASIHVRDLAQSLRDLGHDVTVLTGGEGAVTDQLRRAGVRFRALQHLGRAIHPARDFRALMELAAELRDLRPDLVSTHTAKAGWLGRLACSRLGIPAVYTPHGWSIGDRISPRHGTLYAVAERMAAGWGRAIICTCEYERQLAVSAGVGQAEMLRVVHNGVRDVAEDLRARPAAEPVRIVSVARFEPPKDQRTLLMALAELQSPGWYLDLVGDGPLEGEIRDMATQLHLGSRVSFHGYQPDPSGILARAGVFALSSQSEAFPRSILEAMRAGLPVVAADVGGIAEAVADGGSGVLVPRSDPGALASALRRLLETPGLRKRMGDAGRQIYESRFRLEPMVERTLAVYNEVLKG